MVHCLCVVAMLFFFNGTIKSMEVMEVAEKQDSSWNFVPTMMYDYFFKKPVVMEQSKEDIRKYTLHGINTITIDGNKGRGADSFNYPRMKVTIEQITGSNVSEEVVIHADKHILPYITLNYNGPQLEIGLRRLDQKIDLSKDTKDIKINLALKNYTKIVTNNDVDTTFLSLIKSDILHLNVSSGATMQLPLIDANTVELFADENSSVGMQDKARLNVKDLLFIYRQGLAKIVLAIETKLLQLQSYGNGETTLQGIATKQELLLSQGSLFGIDLQSETIRMAQGIGHEESKIELWAEDSISGCMLLKSKYDATFRAPNMSSIEFYRIKQDAWDKRFGQQQ